MTKKERHLDRVIAGGDSALLDVDVRWRMSEFAFLSASGTLAALELATDLDLKEKTFTR